MFSSGNSIKIGKVPLALLCLSGLLTPVLAQETENHLAFGKGPRPSMEVGVKMLNLSDEQLEKLARLKSDMMDSSAVKHAKAMTLRHKMADLLTSSEIDQAKIHDVKNQLDTIEQELSASRIDFMVNSANVLTAEQRGKLRHKWLMRQLGPVGAMGGPGMGFPPFPPMPPPSVFDFLMGPPPPPGPPPGFGHGPGPGFCPGPGRGPGGPGAGPGPGPGPAPDSGPGAYGGSSGEDTAS
ncbi:MAG: periplasmic heavy metal sensor [Cyanobacteria bacterium HKST-UBA02]|nr:periplasmic heavy metal sensor [Cyanobacteria bacterium HKST-UBA02]